MEIPSPAEARSAWWRSRFAVGGLIVAAILAPLALALDVMGLAAIDAAAAGRLSEAAARTFDSQFALVGLAQSAVLITTGVAFLAWLSRSIANLPSLGGGEATVTPTMSIVWWFVPFANLVMPYRIVEELYQRIAPDRDVSTRLVLAWWVFWVSGLLATLGAALFWGGATTAESLATALSLYAVGDLLHLVAAILAIRLVLRIQGWADAAERA
jgi:hypothetical protein